MLSLQNITYIHPNKDLLFENINLTINKHDKVALVGNNGTGKSTLLKILAGELQATSGVIHTDLLPYYVPQHFGQYNELTIAQALQIEYKLKALEEILGGNVSEANLDALNDDWSIEERCNDALNVWGLKGLSLTHKMKDLSGGQKTKIFLAGIQIHQPQLILLDEPSNHLDIAGRKLLYDFVQSCTNTLLVVSHDRKLLQLLHLTHELSKDQITVYGGNYDFYKEQKAIESNALNQDIRSKEKELRKAKETERESAERQQKLDARGKKKQEKAGLPTIVMKTLKNNAENSTAKQKDVHAEKVNGISETLSELRKELSEIDKIKIDFDNSCLHKGKVLISAIDINFGYTNSLLWNQPLNFLITSGERIVIKGVNGSGKTSLINLILGKLKPAIGTIQRAISNSVYIDQEYSIINNQLNVYEQAQQFNSKALQEHEIKIRLNRFIFTKQYWDKSCSVLSGGEKMRLLLCCLMIKNQAPDIIILDEPTNNLDIQNVEILTNAINEYKGTLIVVSHDDYFLEQINIERTIFLE